MGLTCPIFYTVLLDSRVQCSGTVNLILCDGCKLNANSGITVQSGAALNIYGQSAGTGELSAVSSNEEASAIGGLSSQESGGAIVNNGTLKIQNGIISGNKAKEGGAVANLNSGSLTISGGTVIQNEAFQYGGVVVSVQF